MAKLWKKGRGRRTVAPILGCRYLRLSVQWRSGTGRARMAYWPAERGGFHGVVESRTKKGRNRFTHHEYRRES